MAEEAQGLPQRIIDPEVCRRARETLHTQLVSLQVRLREADRAAQECVFGYGIAATLGEAQEKLDDAVTVLNAVLRSNS